jgi:hypothetical protein
MLGGVEEFEFTILENVSGDRINERERYWIAHFGTLHPNGLNRTTGGSSGNLSAATRAKIGASRKGYKHSDATKARMSTAIKMALSDPAVRRKISDAAKLRAEDPEERKVRSERAKVRMAKPGSREALISAQRPVDDATRENMRAAAKARMAVDGAKDKVSSSLKQLWQNPEYRSRMEAAQQARWARVRSTDVRPSGA